MPRVLVQTIPESIPTFDDPDDEQGETLDDALARTKPKKKATKRGISPSQVDRKLREFDELFKTKWRENPKSITPDHAVALYFRLHEKIYKVSPAELERGPAWFGAYSAATKLLKDEFGGNGIELFDFILWVWNKERSTIEWLRKDNKPIKKPITWYEQFVDRRKLTHYRQTMAEERERGKRR
jgi:hypothetical protein